MLPAGPAPRPPALGQRRRPGRPAARHGRGWGEESSIYIAPSGAQRPRGLAWGAGPCCPVPPRAAWGRPLERRGPSVRGVGPGGPSAAPRTLRMSPAGGAGPAGGLPAPSPLTAALPLCLSADRPEHVFPRNQHSQQPPPPPDGKCGRAPAGGPAGWRAGFAAAAAHPGGRGCGPGAAVRHRR